jgi:Cu+-exporting ATPase
MHEHTQHPGQGAAIDPVCGMTVDPASATERGLAAEHDGITYYFCGKGCLLDFSDEPGRFLDPGYVPHM